MTSRPDRLIRVPLQSLIAAIELAILKHNAEVNPPAEGKTFVSDELARFASNLSILPSSVIDDRGEAFEAIERARSSSETAIRLAGRDSHRMAASRGDGHVLVWRKPGRFQLLMAEHPDIAKRVMETDAHTRHRRRPAGHLNWLHDCFLRDLAHHGVSGDQYPFTCSSYAYRAFAEWVRRHRSEHEVIFR